MLEWKSKVSIISNEFATAADSSILFICHVQRATKDSVKVLLKFIELQKAFPEHIRPVATVHAKYVSNKLYLKENVSLICETSNRVSSMLGFGTDSTVSS